MTQNDLAEFKKTYRIFYDECKTPKILCLRGEIYEYSENLLAFCLLKGAARSKNKIKKLGLKILCEGDTEMIVLFPKSKITQYEGVLGIKKRRFTSEATRLRLTEVLSNLRNKHPIKASSETKSEGVDVHG